MFAEAGRRAGAFAVNQFRITLALVFLVALLAITGRLGTLPRLPAPGVAWLALSGLIGLTIGDLAYFGSLVRLGARSSSVFGALSPPVTALIAIPFLGERLGLMAFGGMVLTLAGVVWVILERPAVPIPRGHRIEGALLGALGAVCQAVGFVIAKQGMKDSIDPLTANAVRMAAATIGIWTVALFTARLGSPVLILRDRTARLCALGATIVGPVLGVWMSLVAAKLTKTGIAATLMSTTPILVLPLVILVHREKVSARAAIGAVLAVAGVALIFLR